MGPNRSRVPTGRRPLLLLGAALALGSAGALRALPVAGQEQGAPVTFTLYRGEGNGGNIRLAAWGSGKAEPTTDNVLLGDAAIKVTTHGLYQGGRIEFKQPVDLGAAFANSHTYLRMMVRFLQSSGSAGGSAVQGFGSFGPEAAAAPFERMRFLLIMADGKQYELVRPLDMKTSEDPDAYMPITFPLAAVTKAAGNPLRGDSAKLKAIVVSGDKYNQFQIGEMQVITDETEVSVAPLEDQIAFINNEMVFSADAEGGASTLRFTWDWDLKDGIQDDAVGRSVAHTFKREGKYIITLTVTDVDGLKKPQTVKQELEVSG